MAKDVNNPPSEQETKEFVRQLRRRKIIHYGDDDSIPRGRNTIHATHELDVETNSKGKVVAVWFRCMPLPFHQNRANKQRAHEMEFMYEEQEMPILRAVEVEIDNPQEQA